MAALIPETALPPKSTGTLSGWRCSKAQIIRSCEVTIHLLGDGVTRINRPDKIGFSALPGERQKTYGSKFGYPNPG
jgi:hypothetical protein